jgi:excinuclease ABC subunit A
MRVPRRSCAPPWTPRSKLGKGVAHVLTARATVSVFSAAAPAHRAAAAFAEPDPRLLSFNSSQGWCAELHGTGVAGELRADQTGEEAQWSGHEATGAAAATACESCHGARLNPVALQLRFRERSIAS